MNPQAAAMTDALRDLGVSVPDDFVAIERAPFQVAEGLLTALKDRVRANFRRLSKELHPDINGGDEAKTARFRFLAEIKAKIDAIQVRPAPPIPTIVVQWVNPLGPVPLRRGVQVPVGFRVPFGIHLKGNR